MRFSARHLDAAVRAVCPHIDGVSIGDFGDRSTWRINFKPDATDAQKNAAAGVMEAMDFNAPRAEDVDAERDRRLRRMTFGGVAYDFDAASRVLIDKAKGSALAAVITGATLGDLRWADPSIDFGWIAANNTVTPMDAQTALAFGTAAASWEGRHILAARALKNRNPIPADYTDDAYWPTP